MNSGLSHRLKSTLFPFIRTLSHCTADGKSILGLRLLSTVRFCIVGRLFLYGLLVLLLRQ